MWKPPSTSYGSTGRDCSMQDESYTDHGQQAFFARIEQIDRLVEFVSQNLAYYSRFTREARAMKMENSRLLEENERLQVPLIQ